MADNGAVVFKDVSFAYGNNLVLDNVEFSIPEGDFVALMGPNGGGKTTLLKLCVGLLRPQRGTVQVFGKDPAEVRSMIGYVPQETNPNAHFPVRVIDVVMMGLLPDRIRHGKAQKKKVQKILDRMGLLDLENRKISELSGGQRQKVMIARALVSDPKILFLDEPTASVDRAFHTELYEMLRELNSRITIVVVSHDMSVLSSYVKSVACVNRRVVYHSRAEITPGMIDALYHCPVELVAHGIPHRVLREH
ncbi:metal ABC transporter ATP-binding protein [Thermodesulforhabdus norvegica]|uniref:Zinc transport system ATP-binding protein n=1 Tax=Thermodesulforhabdus norvegica TaxID=39841 RepID=A0A1I4V974_9BACT|nr:ABC transporter ATP-binding protein [Thermodesulforhabdus norvegica]SFM97747.1 zinc transport system ATP-binding protein [Thermodesulforhabdus norvegica]